MVKMTDDNVLLTMLLLKDAWALSEADTTGSAIKFSTVWYDQNIQLPQVCVTSRPGGRYIVLETGKNPHYQYNDRLTINLWVRPKQNSNTSIGSAKHIMYELHKEVERIISGSALPGSSFDQFISLGRWRSLDELNRRPPVFRREIEVNVDYYRKRS